MLPDYSSVWQETLHWQPDGDRAAQFQHLYSAIVEGNRSLNLTRITAPDDFWEKHLWDSLRGIKPYLASDSDDAKTAIDIGTGAGFPGIPIAIVQRQWHVTLLDSTTKKVKFLQQLLTELHLENTRVVLDRAERANQQKAHSRRYDLAIARAVGSAEVCARYALPFLKPGGVAILYRGKWTEEEQQDLESAIADLGGKIDAIDSFTTPLTHAVRHCIYLKRD